MNFTPNAEKVCAAAAKGCRSTDPSDKLITRLTEGQIKRVLRTAIKKKHLSVMEHATFTFSASGVSRTLTHQLVRHRIASYSQQSQRYVRFNKPVFKTPPTIARNSELNGRYRRCMRLIWSTYRDLIANGVSEEDARFVLPNATLTNITITMNARELLHFFELRCCSRAQWEIRQMATLMLRKVKVIAPIMFEHAGPPCDDCSEPCLRPGKRDEEI